MRRNNKNGKIVIASGNQHKIEEFRTLFAPLGITVIGMKECGTFAEPEETGTTFAANAVIKAEALCAQLGCTVISDDSGLEIDALNKEPGVYSARYLGHDTSYEIKNRNLIERVSGRRTAPAGLSARSPWHAGQADRGV